MTDSLRCSSCDRDSILTGGLIGDPAFALCSDCVAIGRAALTGRDPGPLVRATAPRTPYDEVPRCAFCGRREEGEHMLVAFERGCACAVCLTLAEEVFAEVARRRGIATPPQN